MTKLIGLLSASAILATSLATSASAWDHCGHGSHRNGWGHCVSNYGRTSSCPAGYHLGWQVPTCFPNR
jgi:hypothetical protein